MKDTLKRDQWIFLSLIVGLFLFNSCKKHDAKPKNEGNDTTAAHHFSDEDSLKFYVWWLNESDSANLPLYYWEDQVTPTNPLSSQYGKGEDVLNYIKSFPVVNGKKVDRYSFLDRTGAVSDELEGGVSGDFGFSIAPVILDNSNKVHLIVSVVYAGSPAGEANIQRGWDVISIAGNSNITWDGGSNYQQLIKNIYYAKATAFTFKRPDGTDTALTLTAKSYHINPVLFDSVYTVNSEKVGYFVYNSFISVDSSSSNGIIALQEIKDVFSKFKSAGVKDLIVDLRYNGGGAVTSAEYLDNLIAPSAANGQAMYSYKYNTPLTQYFNSSADLKKEFIYPVKFNLEPLNLNLNRVFFIVGHGTASASELTINNLKPYMDVKLIGDTTYGKPVGFFTIPIYFVTDTGGYAHVADMYAINFQSVNSQGKGDFFSGMYPDYVYPYFDGFNWGDTSDTRLASALNYIKTGSFSRMSLIERKVRPEGQMRVLKNGALQNPHRFNGMVDYRLKIKNLKFPFHK